MVKKRKLKKGGRGIIIIFRQFLGNVEIELIEGSAALTNHKLEWLEHWGRLAKLELKWSTCELVYVGNINVTQSSQHTL